MVFLPTNVMSNILGFCIGFHEAKAEVIARSWLRRHRGKIGRIARPKLFETTYSWACNGFEPRAQSAYAHAYNHRIQKKGQLVMVCNGKHTGTTASIVGLTECMLHLECANGKRIRVSRCSVEGAFHWKRRYMRDKDKEYVPSWWGKWVFTGKLC